MPLPESNNQTTAFFIYPLMPPVMPPTALNPAPIILPKHYKKEETWSRRINKEHRLVYRINDDTIEVLVISAYGHYT